MTEDKVKEPAPYVVERPTRYTQIPFDPTKIRTEHYKQFGKDNQFAQRVKPQFSSYEAAKAAHGANTFNSVKWEYKKDENEQGFGTGMDDLARILLDNKSVVKFNKKLTTENGALYWVGEKNKGKPASKHWSVVVYDLNQDGVPEVLVLDSRKDIRYINGFHIGKKNMQVAKVHQEWIDKNYGNPSVIAEKRRQGKIAPGELGIQYWMDTVATSVDENNPLGPLKMAPELKATGYKTRPMNPCNMFLKFVTKALYDEAWESVEKTYGKGSARSKAIRKLASIIPINAELYNHYVANPTYQSLKQEGYTEKQMRKKYPGKLQSKFSEECAKEVWACTGNKETKAHIKNYIDKKFADAVAMISESVGTLEPKKRVDHRQATQALNGDILRNWFNTPAPE